MLYFVGAATALWAVALLLVAGSVGYAIARAPKQRWILLMVSGVFVLVFGVMGLILGSTAYVRFSSPANKAALQASPVSSADSNPLPATDAWIHLQSDRGDAVGAGQSHLYVLSESDWFTITSTQRQINVNLQGDGDFWRLSLRAANNGNLHTGVFNHAEREAFPSAGSPGLEVTGPGTGCNLLSGRFDILRLTWSPYGDVAALNVVFEQHCEGFTPALRGELWIATQNSAHKAPPDPSAPIPNF